jgi:hypothetical protein
MNFCARAFLRNDVAPLIADETGVLYLGDWDFSGGKIEANTQRVLERAVGRTLQWERLALTETRVREYDLTIIQKYDRRTKTTQPSRSKQAPYRRASGSPTVPRRSSFPAGVANG